MRTLSMVKLAFENSLGRGLVGPSFSYSPEENLFFFLNFQLKSRLKVITLYFWTVSYERVKQEVRALLEPAEASSTCLSPELKALEENVGKGTCTVGVVCFALGFVFVCRASIYLLDAPCK